MEVGVLGTGVVGQDDRDEARPGSAIEVVMGSRTADNAEAAEWVAEVGTGVASQGTFADAGAVRASCSSTARRGSGSLGRARASAGAEHLAGKVVADISVPLDFSAWVPAEPVRVQHRQPGRADPARVPATRRVVKSLNTMNCGVMVDPASVPGRPRRVRLAATTPARRHQVAEPARGAFGWGEARGSWTWATSALRRAGQRCTCRCGSERR